MRVFLVLSAVCAVALSDEVTSAWNTLSVRWGIPGTGHFVGMPMSMDEAVASKYLSVDVENEFNLSSMVYKGNDPRIVPLYAAEGALAGIQIAVPYEEIQRNLPASYNLENIPGFKRKTVLGVDSWTAAFYFYSPDTIRAGVPATGTCTLPKFMCKLMGKGTPTIEKELWFREGESHVRIATTVDELSRTTLYTTQACIPSMGGHQYWDMSETSSCNKIPPFFLLTNKGKVSGVGFQIFGNVTDRTWHESPDRAAVEAIVPHGPACLYDIVEKYGVTTTHFFFESHPYLTLCI